MYLAIKVNGYKNIKHSKKIGIIVKKSLILIKKNKGKLAAELLNDLKYCTMFLH